ncbi:uncharacterized protein LAESUDRAFT_678708 [Laetiporus sulphureus 93-53]|uniref:Uncharacterized protein n=1 Tax=Laetiporus sulphureus 93-53 TaxID=1314785 RepID=A0A165ECX0_9APHY|nr:uncharacterized protein LAESUDRAFT_678708 [Laetiporus sulphureus 93-53]KZT06755.1 hypothetical protein LAESUDRAFT_678708 [Laetiporus sulphureus 93-53]
MVAYLWLVWYEALARAASRHWALAVTYEAHEQAYATFYEVVGDSSGGRYHPRVVRRVHLTSKHGSTPYAGKLLLGEITDEVLKVLEAYSETAAELVNSHNKKRGIHEWTCHDWAIIIARSLKDALLLPEGTLVRVEKSARFG